MHVNDYEARYGKVLDRTKKRDKTLLKQEMLRFDQTSELIYCFKGRYAHAQMMDFSNSPRLPTTASLRYSSCLLPWSGGYKENAINEEQLQERLSTLDEIQLKGWEESLKWIQTKSWTKENPFRIYLGGVTYSAYSKLLPNKKNSICRMGLTT